MTTAPLGQDRQYPHRSLFAEGGLWSGNVESHHLAGASRSSIVVVDQPAGCFPDPPLEELNLQLVLSGNSAARIRVADQSLKAKLYRGQLFLAPKGADVEYQVDGPNRILSVAISPTLVKRAAGKIIDFGQLHAGDFRDQFLEVLLFRILEEAQRRNPNEDGFVDQAMLTLVLALAKLANHPTARSRLYQFSAAERSRLEELIQERLDDGLRVLDLATAIDVSEPYLCQMFQENFGQSPYQYILERRIARAQELLASGNMPLVEIAYACGFASQSHMTDVFRHKLGVTPGRYRREVRG